MRRLVNVSLAIAALVTGAAAGATKVASGTSVSPPPATTPGPADASRPTETAPYTYGEVYSVEMVLVPVAVRGEKAGARIGKDRFMLRVDGRPVSIESFESDTGAPLSLVFLQDLSGSMAEPGKIDASRETLDCFLDTARDGDEMALATFAGGETEVDVPFTAKTEALREAVSLWDPYGTTGLYDAVARLPELSAGSSGKRAAVLITDGADNVSVLSPEKAESVVQGADLPVYVLALPSHDPAKSTDPSTVRYADLLKRLAESTGGRYYDIDDVPAARRTCAAILGELRHQYLLGFSVSGTGPSQYHPIRVELRGAGKKIELIHRRGYRGTAPSVPS